MEETGKTAAQTDPSPQDGAEARHPAHGADSSNSGKHKAFHEWLEMNGSPRKTIQTLEQYLSHCASQT